MLPSPALRAACLLWRARRTAVDGISTSAMWYSSGEKNKPSSRLRRAPSTSRRGVYQPRLMQTVSKRTRGNEGRRRVPKLASGCSVFTRSRHSWLKNMYADSARFGALGSFFFLELFESLSAVLRVCRTRKRSKAVSGRRAGEKTRKGDEQRATWT
jgi:hypothetical protein